MPDDPGDCGDQPPHLLPGHGLAAVIVGVTHMHRPRPPPLPENLFRIFGECLHLNNGVIVPTARGAQREHRVDVKCRVFLEQFNDEITEILWLLPALESVEVQRI